MKEDAKYVNIEKKNPNLLSMLKHEFAQHRESECENPNSLSIQKAEFIQYTEIRIRLACRNPNCTKHMGIPLYSACGNSNSLILIRCFDSTPLIKIDVSIETSGYCYIYCYISAYFISKYNNIHRLDLIRVHHNSDIEERVIVI